MKTLLVLALVSFSFSGALGAKPAANSASDVTELTSELAKMYTDKALDCGRKNNWKLSVAVFNAEGNMISFRRDDGAFAGSIGAAMEKGKSASVFQRPTRAFAEAITKDGRVGLVSMPGIVAIEGGMPILLGGKVVGGIGVSGARSVEDEQCAKIAIE